MHGILLCCCRPFLPVNNIDWIGHLLTCVSILAPILFGLWQYRETLREKEKIRRTEVEFNMLSEIHEACDNTLTSALSCNRHILGWLYYYQLYDRQKEEKEYNLTLCLKNFDLSEEDVKDYNVNWSKLVKNVYAIRIYLDKDRADKIIKLLEEPGEEFAKSFMDIDWGVTPQDVMQAHKKAYESISDYVLKQSKLKNVDSIRYIISGINKEYKGSN